MPNLHYSPLWQLTLTRLREFFRVPEAVFWVYGFPLLMAVALGIAFREQPVEEIRVDVLSEAADDTTRNDDLVKLLEKDERLKIKLVTPEEGHRRLQRGRTDLLVAVSKSSEDRPTYEFWLQPSRSGSTLARSVVDELLLRVAAGQAAPMVTEQTFEAPGSRYIDFLIPGLIGMNLMGGGLWGVGFVTVDLRVRKLLKRFLATPMRKHDYLLSLILSRLVFTATEVLILVGFAWLVFGVGVAGNILLLLGVILLGTASFAGIGLLIACRAKTVETVSGLMNLVMLPMFVLSGIFFPSDRFPDALQPFIQALPLTALNNALRGVMLDALGPVQLGPELAILAAWGLLSFLLALRWFRWT
jgi:ABC transporter DrrB family efflux protein